MTPDGMVHPTMSTQGDCSRAIRLQAFAEPYINRPCLNFVGWLDDFAQFHTPKDDLLYLLDAFPRH